MIPTMRGIFLVVGLVSILAAFPNSAHAFSIPLEVSVEVSVTGQPAPPEVIVEALLWEVRRTLGLPHVAEPRILVLSGIPPLFPGEEVRIEGVIRFAEKNRSVGEVMVRASVRNEPTELSPARILLVSNSPERVRTPGVLFPELTVSGSVRVLIHHKHEMEVPLDLLVKARSMGAGGSRIHLTVGMGRTDKDELRSGHQAMRTYLARAVQRAGHWIFIPPGGEITLVAQRLLPGRVVSGILQLQIAGDPVQLWVEAAGEGDPVLLEEDGIHFRGVVRDPSIVLQGAYAIGEPPLSLWIGGPPFLQEATTGRPLRGNYGVIYEAQVTLANPTDRRGEVALIFAPRGGPAGGILAIDGQIYEIGPTPAFSEVPVVRFPLAPQERRTVLLWISPQAGSWYPVRLEFRTAP